MPQFFRAYYGPGIYRKITKHEEKGGVIVHLYKKQNKVKVLFSRCTQHILFTVI